MSAKIDRWAARLQKVMDSAPQGIWLYVASGTMHVMALNEDGSRRLNGGTFDQDAILHTVLDGPEMDGGDW